MKIVTIGEISLQIRGVTYNKADASDTQESGTLPVLRANNISNGLINQDSLVYVPKEKIKDSQRIRKHDILIAASSGSISVVGKAAKATSDFNGGFGAFCKVLRPSSDINADYFANYFKTIEYRRYVSRVAEGANINNLKNEHLDNIQIPLPPLDEQKRIAGILDAADELRAKRRQTLLELDTLIQSTFLDLFGDPVINPKGWEVKPFEKVGHSRLGKMLDKKKQTGMHLKPYLANFNVQWGKFVTDDLREMDFTDADQIEFSLKRGDLLICEGGEVGRCAVWDNEDSGIFFQKALHRCRLNPEISVPHYAHYYFWFMANNGGFKDFISTSTISHLTGAKLKRLPYPLPPLALQQQFAEIVEKIEAQKSRCQAHLDELDTLFATLQSRAFKGEL